MQDKILLGLVIVAILGIFVGGFSMKDESPDTKIAKDDKQAMPAQNAQGAPAAAPNAAQPAQAAPQQGQTALPDQLDPKLAAEFVGWWSSKAMDYSAITCGASHAEAAKWMTPEAQQGFQASFWTPEVAQDVSSGRVTAAFQPISVQPEAINPDGSIIVGIIGTLEIQDAGGNRATQQVLADFLVKKDDKGLRIAGVYNRQVAGASQSVY